MNYKRKQQADSLESVLCKNRIFSKNPVFFRTLQQGWRDYSANSGTI